VGWGCGFGPKESFEYRSGELLYPVNLISENDARIIMNANRGGME
jgi:hypothetical protein